MCFVNFGKFLLIMFSSIASAELFIFFLPGIPIPYISIFLRLFPWILENVVHICIYRIYMYIYDIYLYDIYSMHVYEWHVSCIYVTCYLPFSSVIIFSPLSNLLLNLSIKFFLIVFKSLFKFLNLSSHSLKILILLKNYIW